jgi:lipopolysaccharide/colanic/teichoic acid biosynthesis glycosyltransferase
MTLRGKAYCHGALKRSFDLCISSIGLLLLAPLMGILSLAILLGSGRPVLFVQERVGKDGRPFRMLKFRTMWPGAAGGLLITGSGDRRVTAVGRVLRAAKLDELPQLVNVWRGDMSLVGPRPEVTRYVSRYTPAQREVLGVRPGLTDPATILFSDEEDLLGAVPEAGRERFYIEEVLPRKLRLNLAYIDRAGLGYDFVLILRTLLALVIPARRSGSGDAGGASSGSSTSPKGFA